MEKYTKLRKINLNIHEHTNYTEQQYKEITTNAPTTNVMKNKGLIDTNLLENSPSSIFSDVVRSNNTKLYSYHDELRSSDDVFHWRSALTVHRGLATVHDTRSRNGQLLQPRIPYLRVIQQYTLC